jgi:hypothetical protein
MPDARLQRTRDAYDTDRSPTVWAILDALPGMPLEVDVRTRWRRPSETAAEQLARQVLRQTHGWNVIEGDHA